MYRHIYIHTHLFIYYVHIVQWVCWASKNKRLLYYFRIAKQCIHWSVTTLKSLEFNNIIYLITLQCLTGKSWVIGVHMGIILTSIAFLMVLMQLLLPVALPDGSSLPQQDSLLHPTAKLVHELLENCDKEPKAHFIRPPNSPHPNQVKHPLERAQFTESPFHTPQDSKHQLPTSSQDTKGSKSMAQWVRTRFSSMRETFKTLERSFYWSWGKAILKHI